MVIWQVNTEKLMVPKKYLDLEVLLYQKVKFDALLIHLT